MNPDSSVSLAIQSSTFTSSQGINFSITQAQPLGPSEDPMTVLMKHVALSALHNSDERYDPPRCSEDTYSTILDTIQYWSQATDHSRPLLWIYGSAGIGKSAIAQTLAETWMAELRLAASFFFSRQVDQCNVKKYLVPTIAYQLTLAIPRVWPLMEQAINRDRGLFRKNLQTQMMELIVRPISSLGTLDSHIIIIDGLDECCLDLPGQMYQKQQHEILQAIALAVHRTSFPLRFLIASRPEPHITHRFHTNPLADVSYSIALDHALHLGANTNSSREGNPPSPIIPPPTRSESATESGGLSPDLNSNINSSLKSIKAMLMPAENSQHDGPQVAKPEFRLQKSIQQHNQNNGSSSAQPLSWALTTAEKVQYGCIFRAWDAQHTGYISGHTALEVFGASGLSKDELAKIWTLVDVDNRGKLNPAEFHVAMGLMYRRLNGNTIPDTLPPELVLPSGHNDSYQATPSEPLKSTPTESPSPVKDNMTKDERQAYVRAEAQRRLEARMAALGIAPAGSRSLDSR